MRDNDKVVVIHQPDFLPYLGYFDRLLHADILVVLETAQYVNGTSRSWMNRDKIKTPRGAQWLTVCVQKAPRDTTIKDILLVEDGKWRKNNLGIIYQNYRKADYFSEIYPYVEKLYSNTTTKFWEFSFASIKMLMMLLGIEVEIHFSSDLKPEGKNNDMIVDILKKVGSHTYLSGRGAENYYEEKPFKDAQIDVIWQNYKPIVYPQQFGAFIPDLSSIDLLFNCGINKSREIVRRNPC